MNRWRGTRETATGAPDAAGAPEILRPAGEPPADAGTVAGERATASVNSVRSLQSRVSNVLAIGLMSVLGVGLLTWYYTQTLARQSRAQASAQSASKAKAQGEMALPALGRVDPPTLERVLGPPPAPPALDPVAVDSGTVAFAPAYGFPAAGAAAPKTPADLALERRLSGPVFTSRGMGSSSGPTSSTASRAGPIDMSGPPAWPAGAAGAGGIASSALPLSDYESAASALTGTADGDLSALLQPSATPAVRANVLPTQRLLLAKGAFLDCTLETAIDSTLPGMTTCITATDTFSVDGTVVLLERGTKLVGETRGEVRQGASRLFVLWTEARTPAGVVVPLASPGTDELGRAGLPGQVNRHFWERFGAAILISVIDGAVQSAVQSSSDGAGTVIVNPSTSRDIMTEILRSTIRIPPTVTKQNGDRIAVLVARDLDFRSVYELRPVTAHER